MHPIRFVLVETSHPGNIGATARALKTMGLEDLALVRPRQFPHAEATALASGADDLLARARVHDSIAAAIADCGLVFATSARPRSGNFRVLTPREAAAEAMAAAASRPVAWLFGAERTGLSNDDLALAHALVNIPANPAYESLNLAQAVQVVAYELRVAQGATPRRLEPEAPPATAAQLEHLYAHLARVIDALGYARGRSLDHVMDHLRRLVGRAVPDDSEVQILRGLLTAIEAARRPGREP
jgi:TrmH family RNA methyltransferase